MKSERYDTFLSWYNTEVDNYQKNGLQYNFNDEIKSYCKSDVLLLREGVIRFIRLMERLTGCNPFLVATTAASACNFIYRKQFMIEKTIAVIPQNRYRFNDKQSVPAMAWLEWIEQERGIKLERSGAINNNGQGRGERKFGRYKADGYFYNEGTKVHEIFEFLGCYYHGCLQCFSPTTQNNRLKKSMGALQGEVLTRIEWFEKRGFKVHYMWGCQFNDLLKQNPGLQQVLKSVEKLDPLNPRDAFFGGRTEHFKSHWDQADSSSSASNQVFQYVDFTSLYPFVNANCEYPVGHPDEILVSSLYDKISPTRVFNYWGLVKCFVLPPSSLLIPILPLRIRQKLMFTLCRTCCEKEDEYCTHTSEQRGFWGTFCTPELKLAVDNGYEILEVVEIWHWARRSNDLFRRYIQTFLKSKTEASGWPEECEDDDDAKQLFIREFEEREGVRLDHNNIEKNEGLRFISKLLLNSFWGYLGMRDNLSQVEYVSKYERLIEMFNSETITVENACVVGPDMMMIEYKETTEFVMESLKTNVVLASFTTSHARCCLYQVNVILITSI